MLHAHIYTRCCHVYIICKDEVTNRAKYRFHPQPKDCSLIAMSAASDLFQMKFYLHVIITIIRTISSFVVLFVPHFFEHEFLQLLPCLFKSNHNIGVEVPTLLFVPEKLEGSFFIESQKFPKNLS